MQLFQGLSECPRPEGGCVATIGNFDGVHLGHRRIMELVREEAARLQVPSLVISFRPHPQIALRPERHFELLNTYAEKAELIGELGISLMIEEPFSRRFSNTPAADFVGNYLLGGLGVRSLFLGYDFAFGKGREGSAAMVRKLAEGHGVKVTEVPPFAHKNETVSSSRIRAALDAGAIRMTNELLGRRFFVRGLVVHGQGRGSKIQVPTANLQVEPRKLPRIGVYATRAQVDGQWLPAVTNVGVSPTFQVEGQALQLTIETHIFDFQGDLYGHTIAVEFVDFLREEKKFSSPQELVAQIRNDIEAARAIHANATLS